MKELAVLTIVSLFLLACDAKQHGPPSAQPITAEMQEYVGSWKSVHEGSATEGDILIKSNGRFDATCYVGKKVVCKKTGEWFIRDDKFVWIYYLDDAGLRKSKEDVNPIVRYENDMFVLREISGSLTSFYRQN